MLFEAFKKMREERPMSAAFLVTSGDLALPITWRQFTDDIDIVVHLIRTYAPGAKVGILGENSYEWIVAHAAILFSGAVAIPVDMNLNPQEISERMKFTGAVALVHSSLYEDKAHAAGRLTPETLLAQGERYLAELDALPACPLFHTWSNLYFNLPRYALRAVELKKWAESAEYRAFRAGDFSGGAARAEETPAYWGAFAGGENPWASAGAADDPETADFLFGLNRKEWLVSGAQSLAAGAGNFARTGAQALGDAATAFINALKKE